MALRFATLLLFTVCAFGLGIAAPAFPTEEGKCGPNQEFRSCGSACVPDCANPEEPKICTLQCVIGCFCQKGYLKNAMGECVLPHECEARTHEIPMQFPKTEFVPKCPENEEFNPCGTACPATCSNPHPSPVCTKNCVVGCFCKEGHLRNAHGMCVETRMCEAPASMLFAYPPEVSQCKENEMFMPCGSACAPTCANPHPSPVCTRQCVVGCFCKPGYLKNAQGECMPSEKCGVPASQAMPMPPQMCGDNEEFRQCKGCDGSCKNPNPICPRICIPGCACKEGHVRENGRCVMTRECVQEVIALPLTQTCGDNEEFRQCKGCDGTCKNPNPICPRICRPGCACKQGHLRNDNGRCVMTRECTEVASIVRIQGPGPVIPQCDGENEVFHSCGTACPATCANPHPSPICTKNCVIGCFCKEGYLKNANGMCVAAANCEAAKPHLVLGPGPVIMEPKSPHLILGPGPVIMEPKLPHLHFGPGPVIINPETHCGNEREIFNECGSQIDCMASCGTPLPFMIHGYPQVPKRCQEMKCTPACFCKQPYVRNHKGQCVERKECDNTSPFTTETPVY